jgi:hypothetical protein
VIVELRDYTLQPARRDELIELFERELLETQEAVGMTVIGQFRVAGDGDRFVWLRGFADMQTRAASLAAFYDGPVWAKHRDAANATMVDSENVLLLRPARPNSGFATSRAEPFPRGSEDPSGRIYTSNILYLSQPAEDGRIARFEGIVAPLVCAASGAVVAWYRTEPSANDYPRLPIREGVNAVVWFAVFPNAVLLEQCTASLSLRLPERAETIQLLPTPRSRLR